MNAGGAGSGRADWLREGRCIPDEIARTFEACPAWMPDQHGHDKVPSAYAAFLGEIRAELVGALTGGVRAGNECHIVTPPEGKRDKGRGHKTAEAGVNGARHAKNGAAGGKDGR